jgi:hypothetical protein
VPWEIEPSPLVERRLYDNRKPEQGDLIDDGRGGRSSRRSLIRRLSNLAQHLGPVTKPSLHRLVADTVNVSRVDALSIVHQMHRKEGTA